MQIVNVKQGSQEWKEHRAGRITGSRMIDVLALTKPKMAMCAVDRTTGEILKRFENGKRGESAIAKAKAAGLHVENTEIEPERPLQARIDYTLQLAWERFAKVPQITKDTIEMRWGRDCEDYARFHYEARTGIRVQTVGFCKLDSDYVGISPDGLVRDDGGIEIKSPFNGRIHMDRWLNGMEEDHMAQVQGCMWVTGRQWWDFVSFDPRVPKEKRLYIQTIPRDEAYIARLAKECAKLNDNADDMLRQVTFKELAVSAKARNFESDPMQVPERTIQPPKQERPLVQF